jgi:hypothetical protein
MAGSSQLGPLSTEPDQSYVRTITKVSDNSQSGRQHSDIVSILFLKRYIVPSNSLSRHSSILGQQITKELKTTIAAKKKDIADSITSTDQQLTTLDARFKQLDPTDVKRGNTSDTEDAYKDKDGMRRTIREERAMLYMVLEILEGLKIKTQDEAKKMEEEERKQSTQVTFGNNNSGFQLGVNSGAISGFTFGGRGS